MRERDIKALDDGTLWLEYRTSKDPALREELVLRNAHLVQWAVDRIPYSPSSVADREDLISEGIIGLIEAIDRYDPTRGIQLSTYATFRIRGQIADALRSRDLLPRSARQRVRELQEAADRYTSANGQPPTDDELAELLCLSQDELRRTMNDASVEIASLDAPCLDDENCSLLATLRASSQTEPHARQEREDLLHALRSALEELPQRQRLVLSLYYVEELTMKEIGQVLDVSESRVSQLHAQAIISLRALLRRDGYLERVPDDEKPPVRQMNEHASEAAMPSTYRPSPAAQAAYQIKQRGVQI